MLAGHPLSTRGLKLTQLRLLAALAEEGQISGAARALGLAQPAASRLLAEAQHIVGTALYTRTRRGVDLTDAGRAVARRAARALQEIDAAGRDIASLGQTLAGEVRIGSVTGAAIEHLLPLVRALRLTLPQVTVAVEVATSDVLCRQLAEGRLDFALARLTGTARSGAITARPVAAEPVSLIVRNGHPLLRQGVVSAQDLLEHHWVLPFAGAILRDTVERALTARKLALPGQVFETSSFLFTLALIQETNAVAPVATAVARAFGRTDGAIRILETDLALEVESYALLQPSERLLPRAAQAVLEILGAQLPRSGPAAPPLAQPA